MPEVSPEKIATPRNKFIRHEDLVSLRKLLTDARYRAQQAQAADLTFQAEMSRLAKVYGLAEYQHQINPNTGQVTITEDKQDGEILEPKK